MSGGAGLDAYKISFEISPIILTGGIAQYVPGGMLPIISITEALNFTVGLLSGGGDKSLDNYFAHFRPLPGGALIRQKIGKYPFANQAVAANAVIADPLNISMMMIVPARNAAGYATKLATMMALQATLAQHNNSGGTYTVATPSYIYTNCVMLNMVDSSSAVTKQAQSQWQLDFEVPLLTLGQAAQAQNSLMNRISSGTAIDGQPAWSGLAPTVGQPASLATSSVVPAASGAVGAGAAQDVAARWQP